LPRLISGGRHPAQNPTFPQLSAESERRKNPQPVEIGVSLRRVFADVGYRGHNAPSGTGLRVFTAGQKRGVTDRIKRLMRRRSAVEPVIGHVKNEHRMGRNYLAGREGDATNAVLAAVGYNFRLLVAWLAALWRVWMLVAFGAEWRHRRPA
jgi:transposase, IS5 family